MNTARQLTIAFMWQSAALGLAAVGCRPPTRRIDEGWISLFNGKDLAGWKASEGVEWTVENGDDRHAPKRSHLFTDEEFKNFEYKVDCMTTPGSNSGLYFHTKYRGHVPRRGLRSAGEPDPGGPGQVGQPVQRRQALQHARQRRRMVHVPHHREREADHRPDQRQDALSNTSNPKGSPGRDKLSKGSFAIQAHDPKSVAHYKNIKVKPLPD